MADSYVTSGATLKCSFGDSTCKLTVYPDRTVFLNGKPMGNISDHTSMYNIHPFGKCHTTSYPPTGSATAANHGCLTPMPCVPGTDTKWHQGKDDYIIKGCPALLKSSFCKCRYGGIITITDDGQVDTGNVDGSKMERETEDEIKKNQEEEEKVTAEEVLDGIQTALDVAGMIPAFGAFPDLLNAAIYGLRGDFTNAGFSLLAAVPGIGDAAGAAKLAGKGLKYAKMSKATKSVLKNEAKKYVGKDITKKGLLSKGICKSDAEVEYFKKSLRAERRKEATNFYKSHGMTDKNEIRSHVNCIDLDKPVKVKKIPPNGEKVTVNQYVKRGDDNSVKVGRYFTEDPTTTPSKLGIADTYGKSGTKTVEKVQFTVKEPPIECLESTAKSVKAPKNGNWKDKNPKNWVVTEGGGSQTYMPITDAERRKALMRTAVKVK